MIPSLISQCGILQLKSFEISWKDLISKYLKELSNKDISPRYVTHLHGLFDSHMKSILDFIKTELYQIPFSENHGVSNVCALLDIMLMGQESLKEDSFERGT